MNETKQLLAVDLFHGCGGLTLGLKQAGFDVIGAIDNDNLASETYRANHAGVRTWNQDIRSLHPKQMLRKLGLRSGQLALLAGCPPCQGFSALRTRNSNKEAEDERNDLVYDFIRFIRVLKPKAIMLENVPSLDGSARIAELCRVLSALGYNWEHRVIDAADYGVPQRRKRMLLLAQQEGKVVFARKGSRRRTVEETIRYLSDPELSTDPLHSMIERRTKRIRRLIRSIPKDGGSRSALPAAQQLKCHKSTDGFKDVYGRMAWGDVAPTITSGCTNPSKGRFLHPEQDRAITAREAALLQGFPKSYTFSLKHGKSGVAEMIGNALPPEFVRRHAARLAKGLATSEGRRD
ncbi:MAG: DNA cytosine methyltransferase [Chloroflexi bacterium]|nr:DNA cytosine methyltransferase [Chloroflexota bacterium]